MQNVAERLAMDRAWPMVQARRYSAKTYSFWRIEIASRRASRINRLRLRWEQGFWRMPEPSAGRFLHQHPASPR